MTEQLRVKGHTLPREGRVFNGHAFVAVGPATCSCGWQSEELTSDGRRRQAHRDHKLQVLADMGKRLAAGDLRFRDQP